MDGMTNSNPRIPVFIGYDEREHIPYLVARNTTLDTTSTAKVIPLNHRDLRSLNVFDRPWFVDENGQYFDARDQRPFSVQFSHSRFLTPHLAKTFFCTNPNPVKYAIFFDCDFVVLENLQNVINECEALGGDKAVYVVPHDYKPSRSTKMDNCIQTTYNKKLWSAFMVFNLEHPDCARLTPQAVSTETGQWLHQFEWTDSIGFLDERWQFVPGHSEERVPKEKIGIVHWTEGGPWFEHVFKISPLGSLWLSKYEDTLNFEHKETILLSGSLKWSLRSLNGTD